MRKMKNETYKIVERKVVESIICDGCGREILPDETKPVWTKRYSFFSVMTGHNDWGNDSCDSIEYHDFCCAECAKKFVDKYIDEAGGTNNINTKYITINHCNTLNDGYYI